MVVTLYLGNGVQFRATAKSTITWLARFVAISEYPSQRGSNSFKSDGDATGRLGPGRLRAEIGAGCNFIWAADACGTQRTPTAGDECAEVVIANSLDRLALCEQDRGQFFPKPRWNA